MGGEPHACWEEGSIQVKHHIRISCIMTSLWGFSSQHDSSQ